MKCRLCALLIASLVLLIVCCRGHQEQNQKQSCFKALNFKTSNDQVLSYSTDLKRSANVPTTTAFHRATYTKPSTIKSYYGIVIFNGIVQSAVKICQ